MAEKKIIIVVPQQGFYDRQYEVCRRSWELHGHKVSVASLTGVARGEAGTAIPVDITIKDVKSYDYDAMVFLGREGASLLFDDESARKLAKDAKYKLTAASGKAVIFLSLADAIEDKKVAGPPESVGWLLKRKAQYTGEPIKVDDKLITPQDPGMWQERLTLCLLHWRNKIKEAGYGQSR